MNSLEEELKSSMLLPTQKIRKILKMFSENHYRPLPKGVKIAKSSIDGHGLFATMHIPQNTDLGITHVWAMGMWIRTPLGGFINHSNNPNARGEMQLDEKRVDFRTLITLRDIEEGEEITFFYTLNEYEGVFN